MNYPETQLFMDGQSASDGATPRCLKMPASTRPELPLCGLEGSRYGSEGGPEALEAYLNVCSVVARNH